MRRGQTLTPFGVGAICDLVGESFVAADIFHWKKIGNVLRAPRLERELGKERFRTAPAAARFGQTVPGIPYVRFPRWLFCGSCRRMVHWRMSMEEEGRPALCTACKGQKRLVPMRFVAVCEQGHLADVPWHIWAHSRPQNEEQKTCKSQTLRFIAKRDSGAGLGTLRVRCDDCKAERSLDGITADSSLADMKLVCMGVQPWQRRDDAEPCEAPPRVVQRGATNVYFAKTRSSIDIPPESAYSFYSSAALEIANEPQFQVILEAPEGPLVPALAEMIATKLGCTAEDVGVAVKAELKRIEGGGSLGPEIDSDDLEADEWKAFLTPQGSQDERDRFITEHVELDAEPPGEPAAEALDGYFAEIVVARRLREVRALEGFRRYSPSGRLVTSDLGRRLDWLPAVEVFGEGVFFALDETRLRGWESDPGVRERAQLLDARRQESFMSDRFDQPVSARFVLLHTLAHLLIRELAFESGYASASLRERIYSRTPEEGEPRAGVLIYTAAGDSEGTLGGLARQGEPPRLARTILAALESGLWCSSDPICRESLGQGFGSLNLAACHGCSLVAETSCTFSNALLDRALVVGDDPEDIGFFSSAVVNLLTLSSERAAP